MDYTIQTNMSIGMKRDMKSSSSYLSVLFDQDRDGQKDYLFHHRRPSARQHRPKICDISILSVIFFIIPFIQSSPFDNVPSSTMTVLPTNDLETELDETTTAVIPLFVSPPVRRSLPELDTTDCFVSFELISGHYLMDPPYKKVVDIPPGQCLSSCASDSKCRSVNVDYKKGFCEYLTATVEISNEFEPNVRRLLHNNAHNYFEKICLKNITSLSCPIDRYWSMERVLNRTLSGIPFKKILMRQAVTKMECESVCINHEDFVCKSAEFNTATNECRISPFNRFSIENDPNVKLDHAPAVEYFENNCAREAKGFCNTRGMKEQRQLLSEKILIANSLIDCQNECLMNEAFTCRSFTYEAESKSCSLSHHTTKSQALARSPSHVYYEVSACFEVNVDCEPDFMRINVRSNLIFQGKIYTRDRPFSCIVDVANSMDFTLPVQLMGDECATTREGEGKFSNVLVIQANDQVVTSMDKAVGVTCNYDVGNKTTIGETSLTINDVALFVEERKLTAPLPGLSLHIVDSKGSEKDVFSLGEVLRVQVRMSDEKTYGIFVRNMIAKDATGYNNLTLIDHSGCPGEAKMMREVRTIDDSSKSLESYFEAFSFTGSSTLNLEAEVETCLDRCRPVRCESVTGRSEDGKSDDHVYSLGRRRRDVSTDVNGGDVIEATTLVKKIRIQSPDLTIVPLPSEENFDQSYPTSGPRKKPVEIISSLNRTTGSRRSKAPGSNVMETGDVNNIMYKLDHDGHYCFGPNSLTLISGVIIFVQALLFTLALIITSRGGIRSKDKVKFRDEKVQQSSHNQPYPYQSSSHHHHLLTNSPSNHSIDSVRGAGVSSNMTRAPSSDSRMSFVY